MWLATTRNSWKLAGVIMLLVCSVARAQGPSGDPRGLYVYGGEVTAHYSPQDGRPDVKELLASLATIGVDGITLVLNWSAIETQPGNYEWSGLKPGTSPMDLWIQAAIDAGKHVNLAIRAGADTPCWLFDPVDCPTNYTSTYNGTYAGAAALSFYASAHQGAGTCIAVTIAPPWDPAFLREWNTMLGDLSYYLQHTAMYKNSPEYDAITMIRITGINRTTDEFRVPEEILADTSSCPIPPAAVGSISANSVQTWLDAGYRPSLLAGAWDKITTDFESSFGDKYLNVPIIPTNIGKGSKVGNGQYPFPPIDDNGCVYLSGIPHANHDRDLFSADCTIAATTNVPDQDRALLQLASQKLPGQLAVEFENLTFNAKTGVPKPANQKVVDYAETLGTMPAYETNDFFGQQGGGTACAGGAATPTTLKRCSPPQYLALVEAGISPDLTGTTSDPNRRSPFIEIFYQDIYGGECPSIENPPPGCGYPNEIGGAPHPNLHDDLIDPPMVTISFPPPSATTHWYTHLSLDGLVTASSEIGQTIAALACTGAASGSGTAGFALDVKSQGNPDLVKCTATDDAGHMGESIRALWIDTQPPVTTASISRSPLGVVTVTLTASDNLSGVAETRYRINGGTWNSGTTIVRAADGTYKIEYYSTDVAGNVEAVKSVSVTVTITPPPPPLCKGNTCK
jgi:hypothetical protein